MVKDSWYSTNNRLTVGDVHRKLTLGKQKQTSGLCATNCERSARNTSDRRFDLPYTANKVGTFGNNHLSSGHLVHAKI